jgi:hypothetical protein
LVEGNLDSQLKINTNKVFWPHNDSGFCGLATQKTVEIEVNKQPHNTLASMISDVMAKLERDVVIN